MMFKNLILQTEIATFLFVGIIWQVHLGIIISHHCPDGWREYNGLCYYIGSEEMNWADSQASCKKKNGILAEPITHDAMDFITSFLDEMSFTGKYYLGGTDVQIENNWVWHSTGVTITDSSWSSGEPNDLGGQDCLVIISSWNWRWDDRDCSFIGKYICEKRVVIDISAVEGDTIYLQCPLLDTLQYNDIKITWSRISSLSGVPPLLERGVNITSPDLLITDVKWFDTGSYQCEVDFGTNKITQVQNVTIVIDSWCPCDCSFRQNLIYWAFRLYEGATQEELAKELLQRLDKITEKLPVNRTKLSSYIRMKTSASDHRLSSKRIGYVGLSFIVVVVFLLVIIDIVALGKCLATLVGHQATNRGPRRTKIGPMNK